MLLSELIARQEAIKQSKADRAQERKDFAKNYKPRFRTEEDLKQFLLAPPPTVKINNVIIP